MTSEQLPRISPAHTQSEESVRALQEVFCLPNFILRRENPDYGVDFTAELGLESDVTNFRFQIQLKSEKKAPRAEGGDYFVVRIEAKTLNYLGRGLGPTLLVLYDATEKRLYFEWLHRIVEELQAREVQWTEQGTVSVRIPATQELTAAAAQSIHKNVLECHRRFFSIDRHLLPYSEPGTPLAFVPNLGGSSTDEIIEVLTKAGLSLVSSGLHWEILDTLARLPIGSRAGNRQLLLVAAYAYERCGLPLQALQYARRGDVLRNGTPLAGSAEALREYIEASASLALGQIDNDAFESAIERIASCYPNTLVGIQARLERILWRLVHDPRAAADRGRTIRALLQEGRLTAQGAIDTAGFNDEARWALELLLSKIEFEASDQLLMHGMFKVRVAEGTGFPMPIEQRLVLAREVLAIRESAAQRLEAMYTTAQDTGQAETLAFVLFESAYSRFKTEGLLNILTPEGREAGGGGEISTRALLETCANQADGALQWFGRLGHRQMAFRAARLKADVLNVLGVTDERDRLVAHLAREAFVLGYSAESAALLSHSRARGGARVDPDEAELVSMMATMADDLLQSQARSLAEAWNLPEDRVGNIEKDLRAMRQVAQEKLTWCRHIELLQNLRHSASRELLYTEDPPRVCKCQKFGSRSILETVDPAAVIEAFKAAYCSGCEGREL